MHITMWALAAAAFVAAGAWYALKRLGKLPTVRMLLALAAGTAGAILVSRWITGVSTWYGHLVAGLASPWPQILTAAPVAVLAVAAIVIMFGAHPKESPDHAAELLAVSVCAVVLFVTGASGPVMQGISQVVAGGVL